MVGTDRQSGGVSAEKGEKRVILSFTCNGLTRRLQLVENAVVAVRQDSNVDTVRMIFRPDEFNNISLATVSVKFLYVDTDGEIKAYQTGTTPDGGVYVADWELTDDVVDDAGYINFAVKLAVVNGDTVEKQWFSIPNTFRVYDSVDDTNNPPGETAAEQATNAEKIAQLQSQLGTATSDLSSLTSTVAIQGAQIEDVRDAVGSVYDLKLNKPTDDGADGQFLRSNGDGTTRWDSGMDEAEVSAAVTEWLEENVAGGQTIAVDKSLTVTDAAADAKVVGDELTDLKADLSENTYNLFNINLLNTGDVSVADGVATGTGLAFYEAYPNGYDFGISFQTGKTYNIQFIAKNTGDVVTGSGLVVRFNYTDGTNSSITVPNSTTEFTKFSERSTFDKTISNILFGYSSAGNNIWQIKDIQITEGSLPLEYVPHKTATDFAVREQFESVSGVTRNINDGFFELGTFNTSTGAEQNSNTQIRSKNYLSVAGNTEYYLTLGKGTCIVYFFDSSKAYINRTSWMGSGTFQTPEGTTYIRLALDTTYGRPYMDDIAVSLASGQISYIPPFSAYDYEAREEANVIKGFNNSFKIGTFNVGKWGNGVTQGCPYADVATMIPKWFKFIGRSDLDILCCNEFRSYFDTSDSILSYDRIFKTSFLALNESDASNEEKMLNKIPVVWNGYINLNLNSGAQHFSVYVGGKRVEIYFTHLSTEEGTSGRRHQDIQTLVNLLSSKNHCVVCGDFNVREFSEFNAFSDFNMANGGDFGQFKTLADGYSIGYTNRSVDNIITTKDIEISYVETYTEDILSDHYPIIARLLVK